MAERPSVKDILAKARAAGPPTPTTEAAPTPAEPEAVEEAGAIEEVSAAPPATAAAPLGRPMTLKEKLAAARAGATPPAAAAPVAAPKPKAAPVPQEAAEAPAAEAPSVPAPAAPLGRPMTLKEKLAAAKGGGATAPAATPAAGKPAAAKPAAAAAKPVAAARALPPLETATDPRDIAEHLRRAGADKDKSAKADVAARAATAAGATPASAKAATVKKLESKVVPPKPSKGTATATETAGTPLAPISRRPFLGGMGWLIAGWGAFTFGIGTLSAACGRFLFPNVLAEPPSTIKVGLPSNFEPGQVNERWKAEWGFWIVRSAAYDGEDKIYAIQSVCTHLGCPPNWLAGEQKFKCPCHGSGFYISGVNFEGPAPRPLERFKVAVNDAGEIVVDKSQKFQEELKQWTDPDSFVIA